MHVASRCRIELLISPCLHCVALSTSIPNLVLLWYATHLNDLDGAATR